MGVYIIGFICALILAAIVMAWIAYCMFIRERHKSEAYQYNISDLQHKNYMLGISNDQDKEKKITAGGFTAGVLILPSRHKQKDDEYEKRPDYPESPSPVTPVTPVQDQLVEIFSEPPVESETFYKDGIYEVDRSACYHSDV